MKRCDCGLTLSQLRALHLSELDSPAELALSKRASSCASCQARLRSMAEERERFLSETDVLKESQAILDRLTAEPSSPGWRDTLAVLARPSIWGPVAAAAILLIIALPRLPNQTSDPLGNRTKGSKGMVMPPPLEPNVALEMYVKDSNGYHSGKSGEVLKEGDQIQFRYDAGGHRYLIIASLDGRGLLSPLYPDTPTESIEVRSRGLHVLDGSVILDDAVGPERIFALFSDTPIRFQELQAALQKYPRSTNIERLDLKRDDVDETTIMIIKE